mmetsp:Transcript_10397/g.27246  ORF Transcript_10397/g.27246 Transcript_10397/m.27246 type:complete len:116 (-) Transcript_10397:70-417(-)
MFRYNRGYWITPAESNEIANALLCDPGELLGAIADVAAKLEGATLQEVVVCLLGGDLTPLERITRMMLSFGEYCRSAAKLGGFYVWWMACPSASLIAASRSNSVPLHSLSWFFDT